MLTKNARHSLRRLFKLYYEISKRSHNHLILILINCKMSKLLYFRKNKYIHYIYIYEILNNVAIFEQFCFDFRYIMIELLKLASDKNRIIFLVIGFRCLFTSGIRKTLKNSPVFVFHLWAESLI